ncbi:MAG: hypothetical protein GVY10_10010 [Verrucomicrobia bacterium]|jgi:hypothetical protein|nr:hypothetical protein [Verrucomicrobiota bacterium]
MKRSITNLIFLSTAGSLIALPSEYIDAFGDPFEPVAIAEAVRTDEAITLNAQADEAVWSTAPVYTLEHVTWPVPDGTPFGEPVNGIPVEESDLDAQFQAAWDDEYLYLLIEVTDDAIVIDDSDVFYENDDGVEIYLDGDNSRDPGAAWNSPGQDFVNDRQLKVKADNDTPWIGGLYDPQEEGTTTVEQDVDLERTFAETDTGYILEIRMKFSGIFRTFAADGSLVQPVEENAYFGFDLKASDDDDGGERDITYGWASQSNDNYASPDLNGTMVLTTGGSPPVESLWDDTDPGDKETGIGWINDAAYPFIYHYNAGSYMYVFDQFSSLESIYLFDYASGDFYWTSDANGGWHASLTTGDWNDWTP